MRLLQILFGRNDNKGVTYNLRFESFHGLKATKLHPLDGMVRNGDFASRLWYEWAVQKSHNPKYLNTMQRSARVIFSISRREWEFLLLNLVHRDETENFWHLISCFETRPRKNVLQSRVSWRDREFPWSDLGFRDKIDNSIDLISVFETRMRILKVAIFPWIHAWKASLYKRQGSTFCLMFSHFEVSQLCSPSGYIVIFQLLP